jgi:hypothetical protein
LGRSGPGYHRDVDAHAVHLDEGPGLRPVTLRTDAEDTHRFGSIQRSSRWRLFRFRQHPFLPVEHDDRVVESDTENIG